MPAIVLPPQVSRILRSADTATGSTVLMVAASSGGRSIFRGVLQATLDALEKDETEVRQNHCVFFGGYPGFVCIYVLRVGNMAGVSPRYQRRHG